MANSNRVIKRAIDYSLYFYSTSSNMALTPDDAAANTSTVCGTENDSFSACKKYQVEIVKQSVI